MLHRCFFDVIGFKIQHLGIAAVIPIDGYAFAAQFPGEKVYFFHFCPGGITAEIYRFGHGIVGVVLKCSLHPNVPFGADIVSRNEDFFDIFRDFIDMAQAAFCGDFVEQCFAENTAFFQLFLEDGVHLGQLGLIHDIAHIGIGKNRFYAAGNTCNNGECPGGGNGGYGAVAQCRTVL